VSLAHFQRFLLAWQRADPDRRAEGPDGVRSVLELLDGYQLAAAAWEPQVLALRVKDYDPQWLDQLCFTGRVGWGRLTTPQFTRPSMPVKSSPMSVFLRENLSNWLAWSRAQNQGFGSFPGSNGTSELSHETRSVLETLRTGGALFFHEALDRTKLLPSRLEQSLAELVALGQATSDSFEGLRALLVPQEKRIPFTEMARPRRHKAITSLEFAGRWALLRKDAVLEDGDRDAALEAFARALLRRYGVMFRRLLDRESLAVTWYELTRIYRRLEARGEIRGGHFVSGISGEQFALPEAIGLLRSIRKEAASGQLLAICGADPLNLCGILTPGPRVTAVTGNRILLRDGVPIAALEGGQVVQLEVDAGQHMPDTEQILRVGKMPASLRRYYA
jgi:ATP-dependent Lhr-like helicase